MKTLTISALALSTLLTAGAVATAAPSHNTGAGWTQARTGTWSPAPRAEYPADAYAYEPGSRNSVAPFHDATVTDPDANIRLQLRRELQSGLR
jgi:hypothetical protein